ncbi:hypothetical protein BX616_004750 [Lobosporangium transversale]|uniref:ABC transporter type 1, transmembrane domain-containing protein n=1 Tax=Lobosporangium transversale TaxID=64571 RepID=A0A1Y2GLY6_9FUNG|nr:hypothetical protein BCR41DRAFT_323113 [Lobosporangium transversale]KAF9916044.1 hypothetical protein BX616_004750 [Lobosporangium transversale]ORZ14922.1 hypothetical protein BCR41DRAFT_323113 [Lobosporangium transversale]|eukprot:XP_021881054.1 hypothetical protein BCR41DRAFT_323113 [Lobosporangium transversale]
MGSWRCTPDVKMCLSDSLLQLVPTCIIIFSSLAFISAECGRQDRRRHFNRFSSEVVVQGESQADLEMEAANENRLIKPKRTFFLSLLRCLGALVQIVLFVYLATEKLNDMKRNGPGSGIPHMDTPRLAILGTQINEEWPLWLPVMHGILWVYTLILSIVSLLHPRLSNPYRLPTHMDLIYLTTAGGGLAHFMIYNFGRPIGLWTLDDQISGLSSVISGLLLIVTLATKPLVPPQPKKGPEKRSRGVINPETRSSLYARIAFTWLHPMVIKSVMGKLQESDVWAIDRDLRIKTNFQEYLECRKPTVFYTMLHIFRLELIQQYLWALAWAGLGMVPPFVVFKILGFSEDVSSYNRNEAMFYVAALLTSIIARSAVLHRGLHMGQRVATKAMGMASGLIYEKVSLRKDMDPADYDITDLLAVDVKHIGNGWKQVFYVMIYPTMFVLATIQLYGYIGHSAWAGGMAVVAWYPISAIASFLFSGRFDAVPPKMERSNALVSDFLANLRAIKFLSWEKILLSKIQKAREEERKLKSKTAQPVLALISVPLGGDLVHAFVITVILTVFSLWFKQLLTPAILFSILILVDIQTQAINSLPSAIIIIKEMLDSVVRVNDFLSDEENDRDTAIIRDREMARRANIPIIGFVNASFVWPVAKSARHNNEPLFVEEPEDEGNDESNRQARGDSQRKTNRANTNWIIRTLSLFGYTLPQPPAPYHQSNLYQKYANILSTADASARDFVLKDLTISFPPGQVSMVTGTRKSGKSALLLALIGEMTRVSGKIYLPRKDYYHGKQGYGSDVAYVAQDPWLEIGGGGSITGSCTGRSTIRDTILFGKPMDEEHYTRVLNACVLEDELRGLPNGDMTIIGDKNVIWSMSLKQRISLARAVYSDVSHVLMDDCLSFVDVKSRHFIWKNCLLGPLMENKTRIMVTNQFHIKTYLNDVDYVVGLDQGIVLGHGTVKEVLNQGWIRQAPGSSSIPTTIVPGASVPANMGQLPSTQRPLSDAGPFSTLTQDLRSSKNTNLPLNKMSSLSDVDDLDSTLSRETAAGFKVGWATFTTYIFSLGSIIFLLSAFMALFLSQALFVVRIGWLGVWAENEAWDGGVLLKTTIDHSQYSIASPEGGNSPSKVNISHCDYIVIFAVMAIVRALFVIANAFLLRSGANTGLDRIYSRLLQSIAAARLIVFEANMEKAALSSPGDAGGLFSKGTINGLRECFQRDLSGLDVKLAKEFWQFSADSLAVILILTVLIWIQPFIIVPATIILFMLGSVALLGLGLSKEMHRMSIRADRMNKDQFKHTFRGLATIRGYGLERRAIKAGIAQSEVYLKTSYFGACADRWLHWKIDLLSAFIPFSCAIMVLQRIEDLSPVLVGFSLYLSLHFNDKVLDSLLGYGRIRNRLQWALERTRRYIYELENKDNKEPPSVIVGKRPPANWPHSGAIEYINYSCNRSKAAKLASTVEAIGKMSVVPSSIPAAAVIAETSTSASVNQSEAVEVRSRAFNGEPHSAQSQSSHANQYINQYPGQTHNASQRPYQSPSPYSSQSQYPNQHLDQIQYPSNQPQHPHQHQHINQPQISTSTPNDLPLSTQRDRGNVRTNTGVSDVNTVASNTSHISAASMTSVATNNTVVENQHTYPLVSENSITTLIPFTPSATFLSTDPNTGSITAPIIRSKSSAVPDTGAPLDQLEALNPIESHDDMADRYDAPLPPLPPSALTTVGPSSEAAIGAALKDVDNVGSSLQAVARTRNGFGPVTCIIQPGEKIAVCGLSKSGKSTFVQSLFRIWDTAEEDRVRAAHAVKMANLPAITTKITAASSANTTNVVNLSTSSAAKRSPLKIFTRSKAKAFQEPYPDLGMIKVDGLDITQMGLADLRSRIAYLSQRGTVFAGTVRFNLDPYGEHEDAELNDILKTCFLSDRLKLDTELVTPASANISSVVFGSTELTTVNTSKSSSRIAKYKRQLFKKNQIKPGYDRGKNKGKGKKQNVRDIASAPATVGMTSGSTIQAAMTGGDISEVNQRLLDEGPEGTSQVYGNDSEDEEDDSRVELDTNERQLLSLARILVRRPNVVILDNAASKVTDLTAQRLDQIIFQELKHATILSIGHRLDQIVARHNRILMLEHGRVAEFDSPLVLLNKPNGAFRAICNPNGPNFSSLVSLAKKLQQHHQ